ncbi:BQ2448_6442 [Microbotryum intermedium]|uniref:BQ2448_6442 protein n=1 Tax=Microbotryum intermedium TaxID=269621 RepID=A0A238FJN8_9BASI|nr:BQ2448_6442 [Microbotryum intermedium]
MMAEEGDTTNPFEHAEQDDASWFGNEEESMAMDGATPDADVEQQQQQHHHHHHHHHHEPEHDRHGQQHGHEHGHEKAHDEQPTDDTATFTNGHDRPKAPTEEAHLSEEHDDAGPILDGTDRVGELEWELQRTREDKQAFEDKYNGLLSKLTTMRNTLGDKLKQDADELDRREQEINELRLHTDDLASTIDTLKAELIQAHEDSERLHTEIESLRARAFDSQKGLSDEAAEREMALRDAQEEVERIRIDRDEWEGEAMRERVKREELSTRLGQLEMELGQCKADRDAYREERDREAESASNLHAVLEEFQAAKEKELRSTTGDLQAQLDGAHDSIGIWKQRAMAAEVRLHIQYSALLGTELYFAVLFQANLASAQNDSEKVITLSKELKEKTLLTGKLRHEAVILNEHLTEALRRLKKDSSENSVDRRLVSNVLISFLNTPRGDTKRFEMLQLLSSILSWSDDQREQVGLQRAVAAGSSSRTGRGHARTSGAGAGKGKAAATTQEEEDGLGENESFSNLFIEFLLKEANQAAPSTSASSPKKSTDGVSSPPGIRSPISPGSPGLAPPLLGPGQHSRILPELGSPPPASRRPSFTSFFGRGSRDRDPSPSQANGAASVPPLARNSNDVIPE